MPSEPKDQEKESSEAPVEVSMDLETKADQVTHPTEAVPMGPPSDPECASALTEISRLKTVIANRDALITRLEEVKKKLEAKKARLSSQHVDVIEKDMDDTISFSSTTILDKFLDFDFSSDA
ncbi:hypothetical protein TrCOL_g7004 [Triparma columacea]|uniref:Uncharacterized protein n=1 Tax=Triparma columacea TaxID=722753 RepID=A0A9W7G9F7_9STRA|nr:hypothetical protein TrCOL_g7004 [Triparma columacea]